MDRTRQLALAAILLLAATASGADSRTPAPIVAGWVEKLTLQPWGHEVKAKLDTGAATSSIHAEKVQRFRKGKAHWVRFELVLRDAAGDIHRVPAERPLARRIAVKEHAMKNDSRLVVELDICFDGRSRRAQFSLADRSKFVYPVLLGRRFLGGTAIIDPAQTFQTQASCSLARVPAK